MCNLFKLLQTVFLDIIFHPFTIKLPFMRPFHLFKYMYYANHENIIIIGGLYETHRWPTCLIIDQSETEIPDWRPIRDRHASSETNMPDWRPIGDQHAWLETHWRPTCLMGDWHVIGDLSETDMPDRRPIKDPGQDMYFLWVSNETWPSPMGLRWGILDSDEACQTPIRHVVSDEACPSPIRHLGLIRHWCLWWGMSVSDGSQSGMSVSSWSPMRHIGLCWGMSVSNGSLDDACRPPMGLWSGMSVSDGSHMRHVSFWWVSNQACWSSMGLRKVSDIIMFTWTHIMIVINLIKILILIIFWNYPE